MPTYLFGLLKHPWKPLAIALLSGIGMGLAVAPVNMWFLAWVALAPLWILIRLARQAATGMQPSAFTLHPALHCLVWAIGYHGLALSWVFDLHPLTWMGVPWLASVAIALFAWVFITLWGSAWVLIWYLSVNWVSQLLNRFWSLKVWREGSYSANQTDSIPALTSPHQLSSLHPCTYILLGTALWCIVEGLGSRSPLHWTPLAYTQSPFNLPILHLGQLAGPMTVTAAIVAVNGCLAEAFLSWFGRDQHREQQPPRTVTNSDGVRFYLTLAACCLILSHLIGLALAIQPLTEQAGSAFKVGVIQGNIPTRIKLFETGTQLALKHYTQGYETLADRGVDIVLTPEGAFPWRWVGTPQQARHPFYQAILRRGVPAWVGTIGQRRDGLTQTLFTITGAGEIYSRYDKEKLVPLGEYIPFEASLGRLISRLSPVEGSLMPGRSPQTFDTPVGQAIAAICYESAFSNLFRGQAARGGEFILTASNNDPYTARMMAQHHAHDVMRAIESDRWTVRATNTGLSGIVTPHGKTVWMSGYRTYETHAHTIHRRQTKTLYVRWGNWLTPLLFGLALLSEGLAYKTRYQR